MMADLSLGRIGAANGTPGGEEAARGLVAGLVRVAGVGSHLVIGWMVVVDEALGDVEGVVVVEAGFTDIKFG